MSKENNKSVNNWLSETTTWLIIVIAILLVLVIILGLSYFTNSTKLKDNEYTIWFLFMLFAAVISCLFNAVISFVSRKLEKKRDADIMQEITKEVSVALKQSNLVSGIREDILRLLMNQSSITGEIKRIRIFAHESRSFSKFFASYSEENKKSLEVIELDILIHSPKVDKDHPVIKEWVEILENNKIDTLRIRNPDKVDRRSFYGMVIEFKGHLRIGLIGFYQPKGKDNESAIPLNSPYGVFSESTILDVLDEYFEHYWSISEPLYEKYKNPYE